MSRIALTRSTIAKFRGEQFGGEVGGEICDLFLALVHLEMKLRVRQAKPTNQVRTLYEFDMRNIDQPIKLDFHANKYIFIVLE